MSFLDLLQRLQESYEPYRDASTDTDLLSLAVVRALCTEKYPAAVIVVCDITDQGGDTLVFSGLEDAGGEEVDVDDDDRDTLDEALGNLHYEQVENRATKRMPEPIIDLRGEFPIPPVPPVLYEKCAECHLFVEPNDAHEPGDDLAPYVHLHRGDEADEAIEDSHQAEPSGMLATLEVWKAFGPPLMRIRFVDGPQRGVRIGYHGEEHLYPLADDDQRSEHEIARHAFTHIGVDVIVDDLPHNAQEG